MIQRILRQSIESRLFKGKAILLMGPRQVGKTTLVRQIASTYENDVLWLSGDDTNDRARLNMPNLTTLKTLIGKKKFIVVDEAQRIENIGLTLKLIVDHFEEIKVVATGSSSFELANSLNEPLTGRKYEFLMFPISFGEMVEHTDAFRETGNLENRMIFGSYPEVVTSPGEEKEKLSLLSDSYLYKDLLTYEKIKKPILLSNLLQALALQLGNEVSYNELSQVVGADKQTVEHYIDLLEKTYIVFRLRAFSRNVRNELKKSRKVYFYDNGIRNAIIGNFAPLVNRQDKGALWENYLISERWKKISYRSFYGHRYFWRTTQQQEIDYLEEVDGKVSAYEFKWDPTTSSRFSKTFLNAYPVENTQVINPENYPAWLLDETQ